MIAVFCGEIYVRRNRITDIKQIVKIRYSYYTELGNNVKKKAAQMAILQMKFRIEYEEGTNE